MLPVDYLLFSKFFNSFSITKKSFDAKVVFIRKGNDFDSKPETEIEMAVKPKVKIVIH